MSFSEEMLYHAQQIAKASDVIVANQLRSDKTCSFDIGCAPFIS